MYYNTGYAFDKSLYLRLQHTRKIFTYIVQHPTPTYTHTCTRSTGVTTTDCVDSHHSGEGSSGVEETLEDTEVGVISKNLRIRRYFSNVVTIFRICTYSSQCDLFTIFYREIS